MSALGHLPSATPGEGPERWIRAFAVLYLEVEAGLRPMRHIRPLLVPDLQLRLGLTAGRPSGPGEIRRVVVQRRGTVCEAVVLLGSRDGRAGALVLALRRDAEGWRVIEVGRPEQPVPPPTADLAEIRLPQLTWHDEGAPTGPRPGWALPDGWSRQAVAA